MVQKAALILLLAPTVSFALPSCADKVDAGERTSCPDSWLKIPRWVSYRASSESSLGIYASSETAMGRAVAQWIKAKGALQIYEGPAFENRDGVSKIRWSNGSAVPDSIWTFAISVGKDGSLETIAVLAALNSPMIASPHLTTIDAIEALTGLDFLAELPDAREGPLEASKAQRLWGSPVPPPKPTPAAPPKPIAKPAPLKAVVEPKIPTQKPSDMSESEWKAQQHWLEGGKKMGAGDMEGARDAFTKCLESDENRGDCSSAIMRTFGP